MELNNSIKVSERTERLPCADLVLPLRLGDLVVMAMGKPEKRTICSSFAARFGEYDPKKINICCFSYFSCGYHKGRRKR